MALQETKIGPLELCFGSAIWPEALIMSLVAE